MVTAPWSRVTSEDGWVVLGAGPLAGQRVRVLPGRGGGLVPEMWVAAPCAGAVVPGPWYGYVAGSAGYEWGGGVRVGV